MTTQVTLYFAVTENVHGLCECAERELREERFQAFQPPLIKIGSGVVKKGRNTFLPL